MPDTSRTPIAFVACLLATGVATAVDTSPVSGHYEEAKPGPSTLWTGWPTPRARGDSVHVVSKPIASALLRHLLSHDRSALAGALAQCSFLEVTLDSDAASQSRFGQSVRRQGREEEVAATTGRQEAR